MAELSPTRIELERRVRNFVGIGNEDKGESSSLAGASALALLGALLSFLWGRRRGRRSTRRSARR